MKIIAMLIFLSLNVFGSDFFKGKTTLEDPFSLRDPFAKKDDQKQEVVSSKYAETQSGKYTNLPTLEKFKDIEIDKITVTGIVFGTERRAFVTLPDDETHYVLKEGSIIGKSGSELKAILPNGIVLVEKLINVYGEEEYLETVVPITR